MTEGSGIPARRVRQVAFAVSLLLGALFACSEPAAPPAAEASETKAQSSPPRTPLPRFQGSTLDGTTVGTDVFQRRRGLVYVFASSDKDADGVAGIVHRIEEPARASNSAILGVNRDADPAAGDLFARKHGFEFPVIRDPDFSVSRKLRIPPGTSAVVAVDSEGYLLGGFAGLEGDFPEPEQVYEREIRRLLHLDEPGSVTPGLGLLPAAPSFHIRSLEGAEVTLESLRGKVVVLILFLPTCPHCHEALQFLQRLVDDLDSPDLVVLPVSTMDRRYLVQDMLEELELEFTAYLDPDSKLQSDYAHSYMVPDIIVIDRDGQAFARHAGFSGRIEALLHMEVRQTLGIQNVLLLPKEGYSGDEACRICHMSQHETWSLTTHSYAFDTLVQHGADRNPECLPCHTVGWGQPGGYSPEFPAEQELPRAGWVASVARVLEGRVRAGLCELPQPEAFPELRVRGTAAHGLPRCQPAVHGALGRGAPRTSRRSGQATEDPLPEGRLRRFGDMQELSRGAASRLGPGTPRGGLPEPREKGRDGERGLPALSHDRVRRTGRLPRGG
jgi:peroxiredoxin